MIRFLCPFSFCTDISLPQYGFREPADVELSGPAQEPTAPNVVAEDATSQLPAEALAAESQATILPTEVEAGGPNVRRSPQPDVALLTAPAPDVVPEAFAKEASESARASHVSPRRLPSWNVDPPSPDSVPGVTPSGSEGESLPLSDAGTTIVMPNPQAGVIQQAPLQLRLSGTASPGAGGSAPTPDSDEADDVEAFCAEVESLKARYMVCDSTGAPSFSSFCRSDSSLAETRPICSSQRSHASASD